MKTYPYTTDEGIIELVRKDEYDEKISIAEGKVESWKSACKAHLRDKDNLKAEIGVLKMNELIAKATLRDALTKHDAVVSELEREVAENTDLRQRLYERAVELSKIKQERVELWQEIAAAKHGDSGYAVLQERHEQEISKWQALAEMLAGYLKMIDVYPADFTSPELFYWNAKNKALIALAAYESAKSGNLPDPLAEAVKRMEAVTWEELDKSYHPSRPSDEFYEDIKARLIQAAKGEQS